MLNSHNKNHVKLIGNILGICWIFYTGESHLMSGDAHLWNDLCNVAPYLVSLPNGSTTVASKMGIVVLTNQMESHHVLFVPQLNCNLISVFELMIENNYLVIFSDKLCVIHDRTLRIVIGMGEQCNPTYYFKDNNKQIILIRWIIYLWHHRLGHPSNKIASLLPDISSRNRVDDLCSINLRAKKKHENIFSIV